MIPGMDWNRNGKWWDYGPYFGNFYGPDRDFENDFQNVMQNDPTVGAEA
jgi:hypothetical protein